MPFFVYIIFSESINEYYTGHCEDLANRLFRHNNSGSRATKKAKDWKLRYTEVYETKAAAVSRELQIKKKKSRKYIEWLIHQSG